jgi:GTP-binding protein
MSFTVAIVGRPNVGKSTLFNRLVGKKLALVDDTPGVTRDRRPGDARLMGLHFTIIDTAGLEKADAESLQGRMRAQTEAAIDEADLSLFVVDAKYGLTPVDKELAEMLRRRGKPVVLVANKSEAKGSDGGFYDAYTIGLGEPVPISAEHGQGMLDLRDAIVEAIGEERAYAKNNEDVAVTNVDLPQEMEDDEDYEPEYDDTKPLRVAIIGRPNAGKSTLINRFLGEDRLLTGRKQASPATASRSNGTGAAAPSRCSTRQACAARRASPRSWRSFPLPTPCARSALPKPWSSSSMRPFRSKSRICSWPIWCSAKAAPPCSPSTSGT